MELSGTARIDVSDGQSPGSALIGSRNAAEVAIGTNALIQADNLSSGNGGSVKVLSKSATKFSGTITAEAKGSKGNGGQVEVSSSGKKGLTFRGKTSLKSAHGQDGQLLLDPKFAIIRSSGTDPATGNTFDNDPEGTVTISGADLSAALSSASVIIQANTDITLDDVITSSTNGNGLSFQAGRSITLETNSSVTLNNGAFYCKINDENALLYDRSAGGAGFFGVGPVTINTQGGDVTLDVGTFGGVQGGTMNVINTMINAGGGNIIVNGYGCMENARGLATNIAECSQLVTSGSGTIDVTGTAVSAQVNGGGPNAGVSNNFGIFATGLAAEANLIQTENGAITITGTGASIDLGYNNGGTYLSMTQVKTTGTGSITINGTAGSGQTQNLGVVLNGPMGLVSSNTGSIQITGVGKGTEQGNMGISIETGSQVVATGAADITIHGTGGNGTSLNLGVAITTQGSGVSSEGGSVFITGIAQGSNNSNQGFNMNEGCYVKTTGSGVITIDGTGSGAGNSNMGAVFTGKTLEVTSVDGDINITGTGAGAGPSNSGVYIQYPGAIGTTGSGEVNITNNTP
ncbi:MAG: hypothetical protein KDK44_05355 [Chlamydiia bacterium]|nr:hypothetical protein [Chlamydiia bacterium]